MVGECCYGSYIADLLTPSIPHAQIRESPDVDQSYSVADTGEEKLYLVAPVASLRHFSGRLIFQVFYFLIL